MSTAWPTTSAPSRPPRSSGSEGGAAVPGAGAAACANCGAALGGPYCARCGQRALPPDPTLRELADEAWGAFVSVDGKLVNTVRLLVLRPGEMTARYAAGHRAPFVPPLRLYLACSVGFFLVQASLPRSATVLGGVADGFVAAGGKPKTAEQIDLEVAATRGPEWKRRVKRGNLRSNTVTGASVGAQLADRAPQALFGLVPLLAGLLALVYRGRRRRLPVHLAFALHAQAALYALLAATTAAAAFAPRPAQTPVALAGLAAITAYLPLAMRRVYGGRWGATLARAAVVATGYAAGFAVALVLVVGAVLWSLGAP